MKFDCVVLNPPYSESVGGGKGGATETYTSFIEEAIKLSKEFVVPIIPAKWYVNARGSNVENFRKKFLTCKKIKEMHDYSNEKDVFPNIDLRGGVCYFLYSKSYNLSLCNHVLDGVSYKRELNNRYNIFIRDINLERLVNSLHSDSSFTNIVSVTAPFGFLTDVFDNFDKYELPEMSNVQDELNCCRVFGSFKRVMYCSKEYPIPRLDSSFDKYKIFIAWADSCMDFKKLNLKPFIGKPFDMCTETYLTIGSFDTLEEAESCISYISTKFFHALVSAKKVNQHMSRDVYSLIPIVPFDRIWTDDELFRLFSIDSDLQSYINLNFHIN